MGRKYLVALGNDRMDRIKVIRIIARLNIGGPAIHTILLTEGLDKSRFETVLVTGVPGKDEGDMWYLAEEKGIYPVIIPELGRALNFRSDIIAFCKLFRLIQKERPDIIHTHTAKAGALGRLAGIFYSLSSRKRRCKLIHTFHGHVLHSYFGRIKSAIFIWIERMFALFTDKIITVSENLRKELLKLKIAPSEKIITIPLGLELDKYLEIKNDNGVKDYKSVGIVGRLVPIKNHRMFLDVAKRLKDISDLNQRTKFLIIGDGLLRGGLKSYAEGLGIKQDVTFTGWMKDLENIYSGLDIVILTSLNEGTPVSLIEAMAAGRPIVATNVGGVKDLLEPVCQKVGIPFDNILIKPNDIESFANNLSSFLADEKLRKTMGEAGRDFVRKKFSKDRLIKDIENLYNEMF